MTAHWKRLLGCYPRPLRRLLSGLVIFSLLVTTLVCCHFGGLFSMAVEKPYSKFQYPLKGNVSGWVSQLMSGKTVDQLPVPVVNPYHSIAFILDASTKCSIPPRLVYLVKSAAEHFNRRTAIRNSWGFEKRFSDVKIVTVFLVGVSPDPDVRFRIQEENKKHLDLVQADFLDNYYNNTYKAVIGLRWAAKFCQNARYYFFSDDDMYVSTKNVLRFVRRPYDYPAYLERPVTSIPGARSKTVIDFDLDKNAELYAGYLWSGSRPMRHTFSKWFISIPEYPYNRYPDYIAAGAYVLSRVSLMKLYYASLYILPFRFDDVYLGIVAHKVNAKLLHSAEFHFYKKEHEVYNYRYVIASHGYNDPQELLKVWNIQKSTGNA